MLVPQLRISWRKDGLRISPVVFFVMFSSNGRFLLFSMFEYGNFPPYKESSDLYMMDMKTGKYWPLEINSDRTDSWHCWSSDNRWIVFASKRLDGLFARNFFSYIDENGRAHKLLLLPQKDPTFYDSLIRTYTNPELVKEPVQVTRRKLVRAIYGPAKPVSADAVTGATPPMYEQP